MTDGVSALSFRFAADTRSACRAGRSAGFDGDGDSRDDGIIQGIDARLERGTLFDESRDSTIVRTPLDPIQDPAGDDERQGQAPRRQENEGPPLWLGEPIHRERESQRYRPRHCGDTGRTQHHTGEPSSPDRGDEHAQLFVCFHALRA